MHYFYLIMNTDTYETYYAHAGANEPEELAIYIKPNEKILMCWEASADAIYFDKPLTCKE